MAFDYSQGPDGYKTIPIVILDIGRIAKLFFFRGSYNLVRFPSMHLLG